MAAREPSVNRERYRLGSCRAIGMPLVGSRWQFKQLCKPRSIDQKGEFADDCVGTDYEPMVPSAADHRGKIECRRWGHPAKFGCLPAPERDCQFGVAKFPDQPGFGFAGVGYTIASSRADGAGSIWLSHGRNPEGFATCRSKPACCVKFPSTKRTSPSTACPGRDPGSGSAHRCSSGAGPNR